MLERIHDTSGGLRDERRNPNGHFWREGPLLWPEGYEPTMQNNGLKAPAEAIEQTINERTPLRCSHFNLLYTGGIDISMAYTSDDADPELLRYEVGRALMDAGLALLRAEEFDRGVLQGLHRASLAKTA